MQGRRVLALGIVLAVFSVMLGGVREKASGQANQLPPGHPPVGGSGPRPVIPAPPADAGRQELVWKTPAGWVQEAPASSMRRAQYRISGSGGPAECAVFYFGPGQGGDGESNAARWAAQFRGGAGKPVGDVKRSTIKVGDIPVLMVEVAGTYVGGMGGSPTGPERANYMLLGAIAEGPDANWFFRVIGPRATINAQRAAFEEMIRSIRRGKAT